MVAGASCADGGGLCTLRWALVGPHHQDCWASCSTLHRLVEYLKSWLKKSIKHTTKSIQSHCIVVCFAAAIFYPIYYLIWTPIYATVDLVRGCIMEYLKPDLKRE